MIVCYNILYDNIIVYYTISWMPFSESELLRRHRRTANVNTKCNSSNGVSDSKQ